jgi:predicted Rossmann-fold nucleotide-binding protein
MDGFSPDQDESLDLRIYRHFSKKRFNPDINEALTQRIHDHAIDDALRRLIGYNGDGDTYKKSVGIMGGHGTLRTDPFYRKVVEVAKLLTESGYYVATGGGPGIMEAGNLGAWLAGSPAGEVDRVLEILSKAPHFQDPGYFEAAHEVLTVLPEGSESLAIPTWFYGHEPSNLFATHIAKYFSNSIREDTLLAVSLHGVIFAPGSAGTTQEIFMEATQNHYGTLNFYSPMVFLGTKRYEIETLIFPLLRQLSYGHPYHDMMYLTDEPAAILEFLVAHPPVSV